MGLFNKAGRKHPRSALNLSRKTVTVGGVSLPLPNLNALSAIKVLTAGGEDDELHSLLTTIWVLRHQEEDRILQVVDNPPLPQELAELGREISAGDLPKYVACLQEMFSLLGGKK